MAGQASLTVRSETLFMIWGRGAEVCLLPSQIIVPGEQILARQCHSMSVVRQYLLVHGGIHSSGQAQPLLLSDTMVSG